MKFCICVFFYGFVVYSDTMVYLHYTKAAEFRTFFLLPDPIWTEVFSLSLTPSLHHIPNHSMDYIPRVLNNLISTPLLTSSPSKLTICMESSLSSIPLSKWRLHQSLGLLQRFLIIFWHNSLMASKGIGQCDRTIYGTDVFLSYWSFRLFYFNFFCVIPKLINNHRSRGLTRRDLA